MDNKNNIELIDRYLTNKLSEEEKKEFELRLKSDSNFLKQFNEIKNISSALRAKDLSEKMEMIQGLEKNNPPPKSNKNSRFLFLALSFALLLTAFLYYKWSNKTTHLNSKMVAEFDNYILHEVERATINTLSPQQELAYNLYVLKDFDSAIPKLKNLWETKNDTLALYYLGVSYCITSQRIKCDQTFNNISLSNFKKPLE